jgi:hypothetical protein
VDDRVNVDRMRTTTKATNVMATLRMKMATVPLTTTTTLMMMATTGLTRMIWMAKMSIKMTTSAKQQLRFEDGNWRTINNGMITFE